jgi:hypothetical protein
VKIQSQSPVQLRPVDQQAGEPLRAEPPATPAGRPDSFESTPAGRTGSSPSEGPDVSYQLTSALTSISRAEQNGRKEVKVGLLDARATLGDVFNPFKRSNPREGFSAEDKAFVGALEEKGYSVRFVAETRDFLTPGWSVMVSLDKS